jgi:hypothetical protein
MNAYDLYRQEVLGMVSDREILTLAGEGELANLWRRKLPGRELRARLSQTLGRIERDHLGHINAPEWTVQMHNLLVERFARKVESSPYPRC